MALRPIEFTVTNDNDPSVIHKSVISAWAIDLNNQEFEIFFSACAFVPKIFHTWLNSSESKWSSIDDSPLTAFINAVSVTFYGVRVRKIEGSAVTWSYDTYFQPPEIRFLIENSCTKQPK